MSKFNVCLTVLALTFGMFAGAPHTAYAVAPSNDDFVDRVAIAPGETSINVMTLQDATDENFGVDVPQICGLSPTSL